MSTANNQGKRSLADIHREDRDAMILAAVSMTGPLVDMPPSYAGTLDLMPPAAAEGTEAEEWQGDIKIAGAKPKTLTEWTAQLRRNFMHLALLMEDDSVLVDDLETLDACRVFDADIVSVEREESSTRGLVTLKSAPSTFHPDGLEQVRTDRTDNPMGRLMAKELYALTGHRVRVWVEKVPFGSGSKQGEVRVVRHFEDLGPSTKKK